jgi:hypothetical protein
VFPRCIGRGAGRLGNADLNEYPLHLVEGDFLRSPIIELRRACRGMVRHLRGALQRAAVFQIGGDARGAKGMVGV